MHRARIFRALWRCFGLVLAGEKMFRVGYELVVALLRTEMIGLTLIPPARLALIQLHRHSAYRILGCIGIGRNSCVAVLTAVIKMVVFVHGPYPASRFNRL